VPSKLLINKTALFTRVALIQAERVRKILVERPEERSLIGNIYRGRVTRILPGINAAFVEIGLKQPGFLYVRDLEGLINGRGTSPDKPTRDIRKTPIKDLLRIDQPIVVQITKDPVKSKGPRVTTNLSIAGRLLVYGLTNPPGISISKRIEANEERERLSTLLRAQKNTDENVVVRTAGEGKSEADFAADLKYLREIGEAIQTRLTTNQREGGIYGDLDLPHRCMRDMVDPSFDEIIVDDIELYGQLTSFSEQYLPNIRSLLRLADNKSSLFEDYGVERALVGAISPRVWLENGGHLVIEETEALTSIDVNSGRFSGTQDIEENHLKINVEAAKEIAIQLQLRDIGGIIVVDFIDIRSAASRQSITDVLKQSLASDRAKTKVLPMSSIGLVQITRERTRNSVGRKLTATCPTCQGNGVLISPWTLSCQILSRAEVLLSDDRFKEIQVVSHSDVIDEIKTTFGEALANLQSRTGKNIVLMPRDDYHFDKFDIIPKS